MTIPDITLNAAGSGVITGGSQVPNQGVISYAGYDWDTSSYGSVYSFDLWENGSPIADGRVFQLTCFVDQGSGFPGGQIVADNSPSEIFIPEINAGSTPYVMGNFPVVYLRNAPGASGLSTCFYLDGSGGGTACFFDGAFYICGPAPGVPTAPITTGAYVPMYFVPIDIPAAQVVGTPLSGADSSVISYCIASTNTGPGLTIVEYHTLISNIGTGDYHPVDERPMLNRQYGTPSFSSFFGLALVNGRSADRALNHTFDLLTGPSTNGLIGDLRTYRRSTTSASNDWPGYQYVP